MLMIIPNNCNGGFYFWVSLSLDLWIMPFILEEEEKALRFGESLNQGFGFGFQWLLMLDELLILVQNHTSC